MLDPATTHGLYPTLGGIQSLSACLVDMMHTKYATMLPSAHGAALRGAERSA